MTNEDIELRKRIEAVRAAVGPDVTLVAATKTVPPERINAAIRCGVTVIGENRVQELLDKYEPDDVIVITVERDQRYMEKLDSYIIQDSGE